MSPHTLYPVYQPIVGLADGHLLGFESLLRDGGPDHVPPETLFALARREGCLFLLEITARRLAIEHRPRLDRPYRLFLNVSPDILMDPGYELGLTLAQLSRHHLAPESVVLEITEQFRVYDPGALDRIMSHYQQQGFFVAIDDFGAGYANLNLLTQIAPKFLKLDRQLIDDIAHKPRSQAIVEAMVTFCNVTHTGLIAEGIENPADWRWLMASGVPFGQGYLLGRPAPAAAWTPERVTAHQSAYGAMLQQVMTPA
ncbi:MAG: EAL domain-containing protein [Thermaerobacter sp.]|nr:EAL domain-containing protein [Thermaerobacter sp.]